MRITSSVVKRGLAACGLAAALLVLPLRLSASVIDHDRDHDVDTGVAHYVPRYWGSGYGWGWGPPYEDWDYFPPFYSNMGTIKLSHAARTDRVYINGSYVGEAKNHGSMRLDAGSYNVTVRNHGRSVLYEKVYVVSGKTVNLNVGDRRGKIKIKDLRQADQVYLNGKYAGQGENAESVTVAPGNYDVKIVDDGRTVVNRKVYVPSDKTIEVSGH